MKTALNIPDDLVKRIDEYAAEKYINRTAAICVLISSALQGNDINKGLASMKDYAKILDKLDEETKA